MPVAVTATAAEQPLCNGKTGNPRPVQSAAWRLGRAPGGHGMRRRGIARRAPGALSGAPRAPRQCCGGEREGMRQELRIDGLGEPISHYTDAVRFGDLLFISGLGPLDKDMKLVGGDDAAAQTRQVFENMKLVLAAAGADFGDILKVTVYLTDIDDRKIINPVRAEYF